MDVQVEGGQAHSDAMAVDEAIRLISAQDFDAAEEILIGVAEHTPADYEPIVMDDISIIAYAWDRDSYRHRHVPRGLELEKAVFWCPNACGRAHHQLAYICIERGNYEEAIAWLDKGLAIEPDEPRLRIEKGQALYLMGKHEDALRQYEAVLGMGDSIERSSRASALRGKAGVLIDRDSLDGAALAVHESLDLEPGNADAQHMLQYIADQQMKRYGSFWKLEPLTTETLRPELYRPDYDLAARNQARLMEVYSAGGESAVREQFLEIVGQNSTPSSERHPQTLEEINRGRANMNYVMEAFRIGGIEGLRLLIHRAYPDQPPGSIVPEPEPPVYDDLILAHGPFDRTELESLDLGQYCGYLAIQRPDFAL